MNKKMMFIQALIVICLCGTLYVIGLRNKDFTYEKLESNLKEATENYLKDNNSLPLNNESTIVFVDTLIEKHYIGKDNIDKYCIDNIYVKKELIGYEYKINKDCEKKEE